MPASSRRRRRAGAARGRGRLAALARERGAGGDDLRHDLGPVLRHRPGHPDRRPGARRLAGVLVCSAGWAWSGVVVLGCDRRYGIWLGYRRWKSTAWKLDDTGLHVRRGRLWRKEILVPRSRVQHLDIERGPIERRYGLATLIVHTAGTRQHALAPAGLPGRRRGGAARRAGARLGAPRRCPLSRCRRLRPGRRATPASAELGCSR